MGHREEFLIVLITKAWMNKMVYTTEGNFHKHVYYTFAIECLLHSSDSPIQTTRKTRESRPRPGTHYMKLEEVAKSWSAINAY
jgi:hypothetical protein